MNRSCIFFSNFCTSVSVWCDACLFNDQRGCSQYPMMFAGAAKDAEKLKKLEDALAFFNTFLESSKYAAGDSLTIADHALLSSVSTIDVS